MNHKSILDQILTNQQAEAVAKLDSMEIINNLFNHLSEREKDVLTRRFGLQGDERETLEEIGNVHKLTRERIRQIEANSIKKLRLLQNLETYLTGFKKVISQLLEEHGGLMEKEYLFSNLANFSSTDTKNKTADSPCKNHYDFLISKLLVDEFEEINDSKHFKNSFKLKYQSLDHLEALTQRLLEKIKEAKRVFLTEELISLAKELLVYQENQEKFQPPNNLDLSLILENEHFNENSALINANKVIFSILKAAQMIEQNKYGHWGLEDWREIEPKTINDKIYLILKNYSKPLHFTKIAENINQIKFDNKMANAATVHNELILDDKYILVGRGLYALKEWGYQKGTVSEVIKSILTKADKPLSREEIISQVLEQRLVRKATINLALMNNKKFEKLNDGSYQLRKEDAVPLN